MDFWSGLGIGVLVGGLFGMCLTSAVVLAGRRNRQPYKEEVEDNESSRHNS